MTTSLIPPFMRWLCRRALHWCYREVHFAGREAIPTSGAVFLFGNHANDVPDVIAGLFTTRRQVRYVATVSATLLPLASATYRGMGVIPVMRVRDVRKMRARGMDVAAVNASAFDAVTAAFRAGDVVGIFPEGGVHDTSHVGRPKSGVAKMALSILDDDSIKDLILVPFGVQYEAPRTTRSDLLVQVGAAWSLRQWAASTPDPSPAALSSALHDALHAVTRNNSSWPSAESRDLLIAPLAALLATAGQPLLETAAAVQHRCSLLVEGRDPSQRGDEHPEIHAASHAASHAPAHGEHGHHRGVSWRSIAGPLNDAVRRAGGIDTSARDTARVLDAAGVANAQAAWPSSVWLVVAAVPAVVGLAVHAPLWVLVRWMARKTAEVRTDLMAKTILPGLHLIFLGYLVLGGLCALGFRAAAVSAWWALPVLVLLPRLGDLGLSWRDGVRARCLRARVRRWSAADRASLATTASAVRSAWAALSSLSTP